MKPGRKGWQKKRVPMIKAFPIIKADSSRSSTKTALSSTATEAGGRSRLPSTGKTQYTRGKTLAEAQFKIEDLVSMWADELDDNALSTAEIILAIDAAVKKSAEAVKTGAQAAQVAREHARAEQVRAVVELREEGLTMQDIATVLGVTKGRIS